MACTASRLWTGQEAVVGLAVKQVLVQPLQHPPGVGDVADAAIDRLQYVILYAGGVRATAAGTGSVAGVLLVLNSGLKSPLRIARMWWSIRVSRAMVIRTARGDGGEGAAGVAGAILVDRRHRRGMMSTYRFGHFHADIAQPFEFAEPTLRARNGGLDLRTWMCR